jgi:hypothetical protein
MKRLLSLALICTLALIDSASLGAQNQTPGGVTGNVLQANGVISGSVKSSDGRPLSGITMQLVDARGAQVTRTVTTRDGDFTLPPAAYDTYTLQCVQKNKVIGTSSVMLQAPTESVRMTCTSDAGAYWKKPAVLAGLVAAAVALGATAVVATGGTASGSQ